MSTEPKPNAANADGPLAQLKAVWRRLPDTAREYWREQFASERKQADLRAELFTKFKIKLSYDGKLSDFRQWLEEQDFRDKEAERQQADETHTLREHPEWTLDQVREEVLRKSYFRSLSEGNFKLGLATSREHTRKQIVSLEREKFEFDAAKACLKKLPELKAISTNKELSDEQKIDAVRLKLFGEVN